MSTAGAHIALEVAYRTDARHVLATLIRLLVLLRYEIAQNPYLAGTFTFWAG
jgi:hypothetical protein